MTELNQSTDNANVSKPSDTNVETTANTCETGKRCCGWKREHWQAKCGKGQGKCCRLKVIGAALLIFLLGVMAGKGCSHHHAQEPPMAELTADLENDLKQKPAPLDRSAFPETTTE